MRGATDSFPKLMPLMFTVHLKADGDIPQLQGTPRAPTEGLLAEGAVLTLLPENRIDSQLYQ